MPLEGPDHFDKMIAGVVAELQTFGYRSPTEGAVSLTGGGTVRSLTLNREGDGDQITILRPHELFRPNSIRTNVFDAIDDSDLVIADLTDVRPAVIYEVAFAHALGIWTILLGSETDASQMFYLRDYRHARVDFAEQEIRSEEFRLAIGTWLHDRSKRFDAGNPYTDFYGAPIPDISAANGLAAGYYENFLRPVLASGSQVVNRTGGEEIRQAVRGVLVVKPPNLRNFFDLLENTRSALVRAFPDMTLRGERGRVYIDTVDYGPRTCAFVVDGWLVDVPRTVLTLERSPRLRRTSSQGRGAVVNQRAHEHLSAVLIERFLEVARLALDDAITRKVEERFYYGTPNDLVEFLLLRDRPLEERPSVWG
ncbi:STING domain-containing protein [Ornithinimicrobium sediminis]|uniref:STING domain-containing protein n=1 Tax=Ornithinimicrobium sediminis TaxID=2904603 RepID=UPI001E4F10BE|nr:STING domain-containing protein [Ornithinimicrobium sediminis]MCE0485425.1 hypothetical protein [Ornithinimicrobium sediminis]